MKILKDWVFKIHIIHHINLEGGGGVANLISNAVNFEFISEVKDKEGSYMLLKGKLDNKAVTLLYVYAPSGSNKSFFKK